MSTKDLFPKKSAQIMRSAELAAQEVADWQTIQAYLTKRFDDIVLTEQQQKKMDRFQFIYNQLVSGKYTESEVLDMDMATYGVSYTQALKDIRDSKELFSTAFNIKKQFEIKVQLEVNRMMLEKANAAGDFKAYAALEKNRVNLIKLLPDEEQTIEDFTGHEVNITFDPELLGYKPLNPQELLQLQKDIEQRYGGTINIPGIEDAEIIEDEPTDEHTL